MPFRHPQDFVIRDGWIRLALHTGV